MKKRSLITLLLLGALVALSMGVQGVIPDDADGDGVPDSADACPAVDASYFDRDGDGCIDDPAGARHVEYWGWVDSVVTYVINENGAPTISDGSDFAAIQAAMNTWPAIPGSDLAASYGGTTPQAIAAAADQINLITFEDNTYAFPSAVIAVGIATSFEVDSLYNGRLYRPGEVVDADMLFNPNKQFKTTSQGVVGTFIEGVAMHEAGHLFGLSHSAIRSATLNYILPGGLAAASLSPDDEIVFRKAYPDAATLASANRIAGVVTDGYTSNPVPGAIVFAIDAAGGDTTACEYTLPDGSYTFFGLPDGTYYIAIYPLDGSSPIAFMQAGNVNPLVEANVQTVFVPEYYDAAESASDNPADKTGVSVSGGGAVTVDLITNVDAVAPTVVATTPAHGTFGVATDAAIVIRFSEGINTGTLAANFDLRDVSGAGIGGNATILSDDSVVVFVPFAPFGFDGDYELTLGTGLQDKFGNGLAAPYVVQFVTEPEPPLSISSLAPNKGIAGSTVVVNGNGFSLSPEPTVTFNGVAATVTSVGIHQIVVTVPSTAATGPVVVTNPDLTVSNSRTYTVLTDVEVARGWEAGQVLLSGTPEAITLVPDASYAYVATDGGAEAVVVSQALSGYLTSTPISTSALTDLATTPEGTRVYGVSTSARELVEINADPTAGLLFNTVLSTHPVSDAPLGILVDNGGNRAYIPTDAGEIQVWDVKLSSATYQQQIGVLASPGGASVRGKTALTPDGSRLLALSDAGDVLFYDVGPDTLLTTVNVGFDPRDVVVDPFGQRAYVTHEGGFVSVVGGLTSTPFKVQDVTTGGSQRGIAVTPAGRFLYSANRELDQLDVIDLDQNSATFRSVVANVDLQVNPVDVSISPDGVNAFSVLQGGSGQLPKLVVTTIGLGPRIVSISPPAAQPGAIVVLSGQEFGYLEGPTARLYFNGVEATITEYRDNEIIARVPAGAATGPVWTTREITTPQYELAFSNEVAFEVLQPSPVPPTSIRYAGSAGDPNGDQWNDVLAISPKGDVAWVGTSNGYVIPFDILPGSPTYHQSLRHLAVYAGHEVSDIAVSPDGKLVFVASEYSPGVPYLIGDRADGGFGEEGGFIPGDADFWIREPKLLAVSPNNQYLVTYQDSLDYAIIVDIAGQGVVPYTPIDSIDVLSGFGAALVFHPSGRALYIGQALPGRFLVIDMDIDSGTYGNVVATVPIPVGTPAEGVMDIAFSPDGDSCYVMTSQLEGPGSRSLLRYATSDPDGPDPLSPVFLYAEALYASGDVMQEHFRVAPQGDRAVYNVRASGVFHLDLTYRPAEFLGGVGVFESLAPSEFAYTPDGTRLYMAASVEDSLRVFDFSSAQTFAKVSGDGQVGVAGEVLPAPLRVGVSTTSGQSLAGVTVEFTVTGGGGLLGTTSTNPANSTLVVATDDDGYAEAWLRLGTITGNQYVQASATGMTGSPQTFSLWGDPDPETLPLYLAQVIPLNNTPNVSLTTAVQATFSRGVERATVTSSSLYLHAQGDATPVPVAYGYTDNDRKVSLTPLAPLAPSTVYQLEATAAVEDTSEGALQNPQTNVFTTQAPPPLAITAITPPSGTVGVPVTIGGTGFASTASGNTVQFTGGVSATATLSTPGSITAIVPPGAVSGPVTVHVGAATSNAKNFTVLVPTTTTIDDVIGSASTGAGAKAVALTPDGAVSYSVAPDGDVVIPVEVDGMNTLSSIGVGDQPVAIAIHPLGTYAYVTNFGSASLSVIGTDPSVLAEYNQVTETLIVGNSPIDVAVMPDGSRVIVVNAGANYISVIDADSSSATHHQVIGSPQTGAGAKAVAVTADGSRIFLGTTTGYVELSPTGYSVIGSAQTGAGAKAVAVTADGALLIILADNGDVLIVDVDPTSSSYNDVVGSAKTGAGTKAVALSADGALLYLLQENSDEVIVISLSVVGGVSAVDAPPAQLPPTIVDVAYVDTIPTGPDPGGIVIDPQGSGRFLVTTPGDQMIQLFGPPLVVGADLLVTPRTLNLQSKGRWVHARVQLPPPYTPYQVDIASVRLQDVIPPEPDKWSIYDENKDGIEELHLKFDRCAFQQVMPQGDKVPVWVTGDVANTTFRGDDTIRTLRPKITKPKAGEYVVPGSQYIITWESPKGVGVDFVDVHYSLDDGETWVAIAEGVPDQEYRVWDVPSTISEMARVMVTLYRKEEPVGIGMTDRFLITAPVATTLASFDLSIEEGAAVMRWRTAVEVGVSGFRVHRSDQAEGIYREMSGGVIAALNRVEGGRYEWRDESVRPNRTYYYKLEEVTDVGLGGVFGPYEVTYRAAFELQQNVPNPFNPTTTIKFTIPEKAHVRLRIYDVAGRLVRALVDEPREADFYKVTWDGTDDRGTRVSSGVYFYSLEADKHRATRKMLLLK